MSGEGFPGEAAQQRPSRRRYGMLWRRIFDAAILPTVFIVMMNSATAQEMTLSREIVIRANPPDVVLQPNAIVRADDGGFIIAGRISARQQAWAAKTDVDGNIIWQYQIGVQTEDKLPIGQGAEFRGIVAMPGGSSYLCGNMPRKSGVFAPGLLVHLDAHGTPFAERQIIPQRAIEIGIGSIHACAHWGSGVVFVGHIYQVITQASAGQMPVTQDLHWILALNANGETKWEALIPTSFGVNAQVSPILVTKESKILFSVSLDGKTEIIKIDANGHIDGQKQLPGQLQFEQPIRADGTFHLFGYLPDYSPATITIDENLEEIRRLQGVQPSNFLPKLIFRMSDQSLVLMGSSVHSIGPRFTTRVVHVDSLLETDRYLDLSHEPLYDDGILRAAAPIGTDGEFVTARALLKHGLESEARVGAALDFIQIK